MIENEYFSIRTKKIQIWDIRECERGILEGVTMSKVKYYSVKSSNGQNDDISFCKEDGLINIHMGYSELQFTVKECKEIIEKMKQCIKD